MALQRFTESFSVSMKESTPSDFKARPIALKEGIESLIEDSKGNKYKCIAAYRVPVSRYDWKNLNGRIYSKALWENIIQNQKNIWEGGDGLADHPEKDGAVKDSFCVWHNVGFSESQPGIVEADVYLIGSWGKLAQEKLEAGGRLGFSSSGFGELLEDGTTVNPESYMLERVSDWVLNPSQNVFGDIGMKKENASPQRKTEEVEIKETETMALNEKVDIVNKKLSKSEEKRFRRDTEEFLTEALAIVNPSQRLAELEEIRSYFDESSNDFTEIATRIDEHIVNTKTEISTAIQEHVNLKEVFGVEKTEELKEGVARIATDAQLLEKQAKDWKKIAEGLQKKLQEALEALKARPTQDALQEAQTKAVRAKTIYEHKISSLEGKLAEVRKSSLKSGAIEESTLKELGKLQRALEAARKTVTLKNKVVEGYKSVLSQTQEELERATLFAKKMQEAKGNVIREKPLTAPKDQFFGYRETGSVQNYYKDLEARHGREILPYKSRLLACKTFFEASKLYTNILAEMNSIPFAANGLERSERQALTESTTGRKIRDRAPLNLPATWD
ncbi:MAG: hypothetical protein WC364_12125 [Eubacteriales bacterium]|jgi:hypothetical protein